MMMAAALWIWLGIVRPAAGTVPAPACAASAAENLLTVVGPMTGASPAWLVDGEAAWQGPKAAVKTLWVLRKPVASLRISGHRLDGAGVVTLQRGESDPAAELTVAAPERASVIPGGASASDLREFVFLSSYAFYPTPGCWQLEIRMNGTTYRIVREVRRP